MFSQDRDLIALEPNLFRDVNIAANTVHLTTADLAAGTLTLADPLPAAGVAAGDVVLIGRIPMEILEVTDPSTIVVSLCRANLSDPQAVPADRTGAAVVFAHFKPERALAHQHILTLLGLDPADSTNPFAVKETAITNPRALAIAESTLTLFRIYSGLSAGLADTAPFAQRANMYSKRFAIERAAARAQLDLDNDGLPDATRTLNLTHLMRA